MNSRKSQTALFLLLALVFSACNSNPSQIVRVTQTVSQTETATPRQATATGRLKTATPILPTVSDDVGYYEGIIVITQYYTYLDVGLYEQAYRLLSVSAQGHSRLEEYVELASHIYAVVEIHSILPYYIAIEQQGGKTEPDPINNRRFAVQIRSWGEGNESGPQPNGVLQDLFLGLILEDGKWKIDSFETAPFTCCPPTNTPEPFVTRIFDAHIAPRPFANLWKGIVNGQQVRVYAGGLEGTYSDTPNLTVGVLEVHVASHGLDNFETVRFETTELTGWLQITAEDHYVLTLVGQNSQTLYFDVSTMQFVAGLTTTVTAPMITPLPSTTYTAIPPTSYPLPEGYTPPPGQYPLPLTSTPIP